MKLDIIEIRRDLHRHPELSCAEERTARVVSGHLQALGLQPRRCAGTGVIADIDSGRPGPLVALRADMDALPVQEATGLPYASVEPGVSHACGHDVHTAMLLGAAELLRENISSWRGKVRLLFQPAEEQLDGARRMIEQNALAGVQAIFGLHNEPFLPVGQVATKTGAIMAASDRIVLTVTGKGGHGALPHHTTDPLLATAAVTVGLQTAVSRATDPLMPLVVSVTQFHAGNTNNIISDKAVLSGTVRFFDGEVGEMVPTLIETIASGVATGYRCSAHLDYTRLMPAVVNDECMTGIVRQACQAELGSVNVHLAKPIMAAEDFAYYQRVVPGCFFHLGSGGPYGWHHPGFVIDEACLPIGAKLLAKIAQVALELI